MINPTIQMEDDAAQHDPRVWDLIVAAREIEHLTSEGGRSRWSPVVWETRLNKHRQKLRTALEAFPGFARETS